jgi:hypothetical protein
MPRELHAYDYVNAAYSRVREALLRDGKAIFQRATASAASRAGDVGATLRVDVGPLQVGVDVSIEMKGHRDETTALGERSTHFELGWTATRAPGLFPSMEGTLSLLPLGSRETQLDFHARYEPPLGVVGDALDAVAGRRVAEASLRRFIEDVCARLRAELAA